MTVYVYNDIDIKGESSAFSGMGRLEPIELLVKTKY